MKAARSLAGAALAISAVTILARAAGFGRTLVFARTVGFDCLGSTYQTANTVPNIVFEVVAGGALATLVVPLIAGHIDTGDIDSASETVSALLTWCLTLLVPAAVVLAVAARPIMSLLVGTPPASCGRDAVLTVGARMLTVFAPQVPLYGVGLVLAGVAQAHRRFLGPALAPLLSSLVVITTYVLFRTAGGSADVDSISRSRELLLSLGTTAGVVVLSLSLLVPLRRTGLRLRPRWDLEAGAARAARRLAVAGVLTLVAQQVAVAAGLRLANDHGVPGAVALFALASTVYLLPWAVLAVPLATSAFPRAAAAYAAGDSSRWAAVTAATGRAITIVTALAAAVLVATSEPLARLVAKGAPGSPDLHRLGLAIAVLAPGLLGYGVIAHLGRALAARADAWGAARATAIGWVTVAVVDVVVVQAVSAGWVVVALAAGNTAGMTVAGVLLAARAGAGGVGLTRQLLLSVSAAGVAGAAGWMVVHRWGAASILGSALQVAVVGACVAVLYSALLISSDRAELMRLRSTLHE